MNKNKTTKENLRIIFLGTPEFAVESLRTLVENGYNVVAVITMPDKPGGRGYKIQPSPIKKYAVENDLKLLQPENLKDEQFLSELRDLKADLQVVVAFRMLPEVVWNMPSKGTFNLHSSLLPQYRGAAPINWAIMNGENETGVTTFFLSHEIDTGEIIFREKTEISETDNAESLHDRLMVMGAKLVRKTVDAIIENNISPIPQSELINENSLLKQAPKIFKDTCRIDWNKNSKELYNFIRGLSPYPAAWTIFVNSEGEQFRFKIFSAEKLESTTESSLPAGTIKSDNKTFIDVAVKDGFLRLIDIQMSGKKRMNVIDLLNGFSIEEKSRFH